MHTLRMFQHVKILETSKNKQLAIIADDIFNQLITKVETIKERVDRTIHISLVNGDTIEVDVSQNRFDSYDFMVDDLRLVNPEGIQAILKDEERSYIFELIEAREIFGD